jgi:hypothetical protein
MHPARQNQDNADAQSHPVVNPPANPAAQRHRQPHENREWKTPPPERVRVRFLTGRGISRVLHEEAFSNQEVSRQTRDTLSAF